MELLQQYYFKYGMNKYIKITEIFNMFSDIIAVDIYMLE